MSGNGSCADNKLREGAGAHRAYASGESHRGGVTAEDAVGPLKRHPNVIPIAGAKNARQARDSAATPSWTLSFEELTRICSSGRHGEGGFGLAETASASVPRGRWRVRQLSLAAAGRRRRVRGCCAAAAAHCGNPMRCLHQKRSALLRGDAGRRPGRHKRACPPFVAGQNRCGCRHRPM
jgi:hypothetical protein